MRSLDPENTDKPKLLDGGLVKVMHQNAGNANAKFSMDKVYGQLALLDQRISHLVTASYAEDKSFMQALADLDCY